MELPRFYTISYLAKITGMSKYNVIKRLHEKGIQITKPDKSKHRRVSREDALKLLNKR